ncbi:three-Cys-motif partner protein TcmP [Treponema endosymbiont of Eucomonympha sp.]|uniref:three-Cys-motif partner protein TcmP n=1 Tax=Treponema endosymbiont of Eucomonympha sp. TaxID=1580831 RepID=UPI000784C955|nr:three-Cys-motif partner protein TcmP [Treponema endosymbiont of Eucomonympha sp.]
MSKRNDAFFKEKKPWSIVKDELLACYFKPYVTKILTTHKPLVYVDGFAGKGKFEDGNNGSPLIALDIVNECVSATSVISSSITAYFIDLNYADDLHKNLPQQNRVIIISGAYEDTIENILSQKEGCNIFLYIDPYGIKALQHSLFKTFAKRAFNSIELLINLNSFGFIREACHVLGKDYAKDMENDFFDDLVEYDTTEFDTSAKSIEELSAIAGGDYWIKIINEYKSGKYNGYEAEKIFADQYYKKLQESYQYVLNMPLRIKQGQRPKYRMVHATNHPDGCILMADNICTRWESWQNIQKDRQPGLFEEDHEENIIDSDRIKKDLCTLLPSFTKETQINIFLAEFFSKYGPYCKSGIINGVIKGMEQNTEVVIRRNPSKTPTGKPSGFLSFDNEKQAYIRSAT